MYGSYLDMVERERAMPADRRIDFVSVVTPNHMHFPVAKNFLEAGFHVVCDKPMTLMCRRLVVSGGWSRDHDGCSR